MSDAARLMDRIYGPQRHIYDATRKFYLLGRDRVIADLAPPHGSRVLEVGCGTGRNLIHIARSYPDVRCYGVDVSQAMLETAAKSIARAGLADRIQLAAADATAFDPNSLFGVEAFDRILISYALSMIPPWRDVLRRSADLLAPGGSLRVVDFGDQARLPKLFKSLLEAWLATFHVTPREQLADEIEALARDRRFAAKTQPLFRGYAISAALTNAPLAN